MTEPVLEVKNLTKRFGPSKGGFLAVDNISFKIDKGEILGLLGPNGAGKTTTIDMVLGLTKPTSGEVIIFGLSFEKNRVTILKKVNFTAAYINLPWKLKVIENLNTFARLYEVDDYRVKIEKILTEFQIEEFKNKYISDLSSGQRAKVYLAKAFVNDPKLLILDEPTAYLDPDIADFVRKLIIRRVEEEKITVLFTSHNMAEVTQLCDRVIFINKGKIIAEDVPEELAREIKNCKIKLFFMAPDDKVTTLLQNYQYSFRIEKKEITIELEEEKIGQLLGRLSLAKLKYSQITIEKPTLEDFFLEAVRGER